MFAEVKNLAVKSRIGAVGLAILLVLALTGAAAYFFQRNRTSEANVGLTEPKNSGRVIFATPVPVKEFGGSDNQNVLTAEEKERIDGWIEDNNLNQYGDSKNLFYAGGTPLFNEATGQKIDRYDYIISRHPDRPWNQ